MGSVKHVRKLIGNKDFPTFTTGHPISGRSQIQTKLLIIRILFCFIFFKNFRYNIANVFWVLLFLKNADKMCRENLGKCFDLTALHRLPSHSSVFTFCFASFNFFSMTVFKREIKNIKKLFNIRNAVSLPGVMKTGLANIS